MTDTDVLEIALMTMIVSMKLTAPILIPALGIGFLVSLFQSMTQIQEFTLAFVPKLLGISLSVLVFGKWMLATLVTFTQDLFERVPSLLG